MRIRIFPFHLKHVISLFIFASLNDFSKVELNYAETDIKHNGKEKKERKDPILAHEILYLFQISDTFVAFVVI